MLMVRCLGEGRDGSLLFRWERMEIRGLFFLLLAFVYRDVQCATPT